MKSYASNERHLIFDIGGGCGETYRCLNPKLSPEQLSKFLYLIVDSGPLVVMGREIHKHDAQVDFLDYVEEADWPHKYVDSENSLFMSSVLHYVPHPEAFLSGIISNLRPENIFISRFPVHLDARNIAFGIQNVKLGSNVVGHAVVNLFPSGWLESWLTNQGFELSSAEGFDGPSQAYFEAGCNWPIYIDVKLVSYHFKKAV
jgi:putative methyltransferase (TIGR04325 family)